MPCVHSNNDLIVGKGNDSRLMHMRGSDKCHAQVAMFPPQQLALLHVNNIDKKNRTSEELKTHNSFMYDLRPKAGGLFYQGVLY